MLITVLPCGGRVWGYSRGMFSPNDLGHPGHACYLPNQVIEMSLFGSWGQSSMYIYSHRGHCCAWRIYVLANIIIIETANT